jgi:FixJ family two-component response regulator
MPNLPIQVYVVDDEPAVCTSLARLLRSARMLPQTFLSVEQLLQADLSSHNSCVVSDVRMPGTSGLALPALLAEAGIPIPVIFVTAHDSPDMRRMAQQAGAIACFRKPVDDRALLDAIIHAVGGASDKPSPAPATPGEPG